VRTAQTLRDLPEISLAFREGRLSYTKVRALTRVAAMHDENALVRHALGATAPDVEERCRQIRNVHRTRCVTRCVLGKGGARASRASPPS
jgi:hypothetical protein